jgi:hypothetical protein
MAIDQSRGGLVGALSASAIGPTINCATTLRIQEGSMPRLMLSALRRESRIVCNLRREAKPTRAAGSDQRRIHFLVISGLF